MKRVTVREAARVLQSGGIAVIPTDTAYALAADARNLHAIQAVHRAKRRTSKKPIALISSSLRQVEHYFSLTAAERRLARRFWPGPLTLILRPRLRRLATRALASGTGVGVRVPKHRTARRLAAAIGAPITATSANRAGAPACYTGLAALRSLGMALPVVGGQRLPRRPVSTIIRVRRNRIVIVRPGPIHP